MYKAKSVPHPNTFFQLQKRPVKPCNMMAHEK